MQMRTALHYACMHEHIDAALELASHDPSTLDAFDSVSTQVQLFGLYVLLSLYLYSDINWSRYLMCVTILSHAASYDSPSYGMQERK